jgi:prepilin-type N-terminal cleavage/methylation domain-containing protein/prepilin-type processing-associated H-X9-DG protein
VEVRAKGGRTVNRKRSRHGFTLIELLVVIAIIAILAALLFPVFSAARQRAYQSACISNLQQLGKGFSLYLDAWDGIFPNSWQDRASPYGELNHSWWDQQIGSYVRGDGVFRCPANSIESYSVHQPFGPQGLKTRVVNYALNNQLLGCAASGSAFDYRAVPAEPAAANRVTDSTSTILLTEKMLDGPGHAPNGADQRGNQSQEVDVWFHIAVPGMDPQSWDLSWGVPRRLHGDRSNYLFVDGHVSALSLRQTFARATGNNLTGSDSPMPPPGVGAGPPPGAATAGGTKGGDTSMDGQPEGDGQNLGMWGLSPSGS